MFDISGNRLNRYIKESFESIIPLLSNKLSDDRIAYGKKIKITGKPLDIPIGHGFRSSDGKEYQAYSMAFIVCKEANNIGFKFVSIFPDITAAGKTEPTGRTAYDAYIKNRSPLFETYLRCINEDANKKNRNLRELLIASYYPAKVSEEGDVWSEKIKLQIQNDKGTTELNINMYEGSMSYGRKSLKTVPYNRAVQSIPEHYRLIFSDQCRHVNNFINMYRHVNEGIKLPKSFDTRTQYEIEDTKELNNYGFGLSGF
ncbi:MAG: hypothetical protein K2P35_09125 [Lachnospiraceae bacterium]|nr:hypothetical protein [Lachnospiraceae bacterium]